MAIGISPALVLICSYSPSVKRKPISSDCFSAFGLGLRQVGLF
ncbi:hypothetical protein [uncultured Gammaproteobacteria bacterium]|nr:hypothetical protein [uncultured Gammaproteobacteria bacterium]